MLWKRANIQYRLGIVYQCRMSIFFFIQILNETDKFFIAKKLVWTNQRTDRTWVNWKWFFFIHFRKMIKLDISKYWLRWGVWGKMTAFIHKEQCGNCGRHIHRVLSAEFQAQICEAFARWSTEWREKINEKSYFDRRTAWFGLRYKKWWTNFVCAHELKTKAGEPSNPYESGHRPHPQWIWKKKIPFQYFNMEAHSKEH